MSLPRHDAGSPVAIITLYRSRDWKTPTTWYAWKYNVLQFTSKKYSFYISIWEWGLLYCRRGRQKGPIVWKTVAMLYTRLYVIWTHEIPCNVSATTCIYPYFGTDSIYLTLLLANHGAKFTSKLNGCATIRHFKQKHFISECLENLQNLAFKWKGFRNKFYNIIIVLFVLFVFILKIFLMFCA